MSLETQIGETADIVTRLEGRVALLKQERGDDAPCYVELECTEAAAEIRRLRDLHEPDSKEQQQ